MQRALFELLPTWALFAGRELPEGDRAGTALYQRTLLDAGRPLPPLTRPRFVGYAEAKRRAEAMASPFSTSIEELIATHGLSQPPALAEQARRLCEAGHGAALPALAALYRPPWDPEPLIALGRHVPTWQDRLAARYPLEASAALLERIAARLVRSRAREVARA